MTAYQAKSRDLAEALRLTPAGLEQRRQFHGLDEAERAELVRLAP